MIWVRLFRVCHITREHSISFPRLHMLRVKSCLGMPFRILRLIECILLLVDAFHHSLHCVLWKVRYCTVHFILWFGFFEYRSIRRLSSSMLADGRSSGRFSFTLPFVKPSFSQNQLSHFWSLTYNKIIDDFRSFQYSFFLDNKNTEFWKVFDCFSCSAVHSFQLWVVATVGTWW